MNNFNYFSVLVIGENPDELISKYDLMSDVETPYIIYHYSDKYKIRKNKIKIYEELLKSNLSLKDQNSIKTKIEELKATTDDEYYNELSEKYYLDSDMNIIDTENPDGKWITCDKGGRVYSSYIKDLNGNNVVSTTVGSVDWSSIHMNKDKVDIYNRTWDLCVEKIQPETDKDLNILKNMSKYGQYFTQFKNKEEYTIFSCSFFTNAVILNDKWYDMDSFDNKIWVSQFYNNFILPLPDKTKITIYECTK